MSTNQIFGGFPQPEHHYPLLKVILILVFLVNSKLYKNTETYENYFYELLMKASIYIFPKI